MRITLLGTGCPQVDQRRFGPASLVCAGERRFLIDCGSGVTQRLLGAGSSGAELDAVLLTHLHSDHVIDLYQLIISSWHQGRERPQCIFGPAGTRAFAEATMELWRREREQRIDWERPAVDSRPGARRRGVRRGLDLGCRRRAHRRLRGRPPAGAARVRFPVRDGWLPGGVLRRHHGMRQPDRLGQGRRSAGARMLHPPGNGGQTRRADRPGARECRGLSHALVRGRQGREPSRCPGSAAQPFRAGRLRPATPWSPRSRPTSPGRW